jgi:glucosylceramidase
MKILISNPGRILEERVLAPASGSRGALVSLTGKTDQTMLGFGAALTESACVLLRRMPEEKCMALLREIYAPEKGNFSVGRICVGSSDYAETPYDFAPVPDDMEMRHFDASHDDEAILPILKAIRNINPDLFLLASPWSPPGWMKTSGVLQGGWMRQKYIKAFALYYLKFLQHYKKAGLVLDALTVQNESETDQIGKMPACLWHPEFEMEAVLELRTLLDENGFSALKIWLMDHNFNMWRRACFQMDDPKVKQASAGIAWHPYEGYPQMVNWFRREHPECENHWTEGNVVPIDLVTGYNRTFSIGDMAAGFLQCLCNGIQSITLWNLALDPVGYPTIGPFACKGTVEIGKDGEVRYSPEYYTLLHFSKFIKRGALRIELDAEDLPGNIEAAAFVNPDGGRVVIASNTNKFDSEFILRDGQRDFRVPLLRESVSTIVV